MSAELRWALWMQGMAPDLLLDLDVLEALENILGSCPDLDAYTEGDLASHDEWLATDQP